MVLFLAFVYYATSGEKDYQELKISDLRMLSEKGDAKAQYLLALKYANGAGLEKNQTEAVELYLKAAKQGNASAQLALGMCYENGTGVVKCDAQAEEWYRKAAEKRETRAVKKLEELQWRKEAEVLQRRAEMGDADAQLKLGEHYEIGIGVEENYSEALKWYHKAAEQGNSDAQAILNVHYDDYHEVKGIAEKLNWYRRTAEKGNAEAQHSFGQYYDIVGSRVNNEAAKWYRKAAEQGFSDAQYQLGNCYADGKGVVKNEADAVKWYRKAAEQGNSFAQYSLGHCYANGIGIVKNEVLAYQWLLLDAWKSSVLTKNNILAMVEQKLTPEQRAEGQRLATEWQAAFEKRKQESE